MDNEEISVVNSAEPPDHVRHRPPVELLQPRPVVVACPQFKSAVNLSRIVRLAGCCGIRHVIACGNNRIDPQVARDAADYVMLERRRSLDKRLDELRSEGFVLVGLEQATRSELLYDFRFPHRMVLVVGHERLGIPGETLSRLDSIIEIPVFGRPLSYNVVTATTMALYEYCKQYPAG